MKPGLLMIVDPRPYRAATGVAGMVEALGGLKHPEVHAFCGRDWAAAVIRPPARLPECGAGAVADGGHLLIWTGDLMPPDTWPAGRPARVLLGRLREFGTSALREVDGAFCGAWYDGCNDRWTIFNDRWGLLPVFHAVVGDRIVIAPQAHLAWRAAGLPLNIDEEGLAGVLRTTNGIGDRTLIRNVRWLLPGSSLTWPARGQPDRPPGIETYWEYLNPPRTNASYEEALASGCEVLTRTVERFISGGVPLRMGISGGMDSRMILAACHGLGVQPTCYTIGWPFSEDSRFGQQLARAAGAPHMLVVPDDQRLLDRLPRLIVDCDGLHSARHLGLATALPECLAGHEGSVVLEGYLFGMVGGSATVEDDDLAIDRPAHACRWALKHFHAGGRPETINALLRPEIARSSFERWQEEIDDRYRRFPGTDPWDRAEYTIMNGRSGRIDVLGTNLMRDHVLVRSPGTSADFMTFLASLPADRRRGKRFYMDLLSQRFPAFARIGRSGSTGLPVSRDRLLREYAWQREKLYRAWAKCRHPQIRRWGWSGDLVTMWIFNTWRQHGDLPVLLEPGARILDWIDGVQMRAAWDQADSDPRQALILLTLGTFETYVRRLESCPRLRADKPHHLRFRKMDCSAPDAMGEPLCASS
ncbi:MAG TPA: asparagine synthase-related protein [Phycisphaerae bacterium]|nr:asparagine synthase-related protein [Phycisphaerae bacterium]